MWSFYQDSTIPTVMVIVNRTPDSFYDRGATTTEEAASARVDEVVTADTGTVDVGGVRTGIGVGVTAAEEIEHVVLAIAKVREHYPELHTSIDTWCAEVGEAVIKAGANLTNSTRVGHDPELLEVAGAHGVGHVCLHTGGALLHTNPVCVRYDDVVDDVISETGKLAQRAVDADVPEDRILIGPTHDFSENTYRGLEFLQRCNELVATGWPVLVALSSRDFVGETLDRPIEQRVPGTLAATAHTATTGVTVFRSHQVPETLDIYRMTLAVSSDLTPLHPVHGLV